MNWKVENNLRLLCILLIGIFSSEVFAQKDDGLNSQQVNIVTEYKPVITEAFKLSDNPTVVDTVPLKQQMRYQILTKYYKTKINLDSIKPAKMKNEAVEKLSSSYIRAGLGTYSTPYAELFFGSLRNKQWQYGAHAKHQSSNYTSRNNGDASFSENSIGVFGKYLFSNESISLNSSWERDANRIYSYNSNLFQPINFKNKYTNKILDINAKVGSLYTDSTKINHKVQLNYYLLNRDFIKAKLNRENHFDISIDASKFNDNQLLGAEVKYQYFNINDSTSLKTGNAIPFNLLSFSPYAKARGTKWSAILGATILGEFNDKKTRFFPNIWFDYNIVPDALTAYATITGDAKVNSLRSITNDNPFLINSTTNFKTTTNLFDATVGIKGNFNSKIAYHFSGNYSIIKQVQLYKEMLAFDTLPAYKNTLHTFKPSDFLHTYQYVTMYDNANYWNLNGVILFKINKKLETVLQATYQNYTMDTCKIAWNKEKFNMSLATKYNYDDKLSFNLKVYFVGNRKGLSEQAAFSAFNPKNYSDVLLGTKRYYDTRYVVYDLPAYVDANIGAEYRHTKKLSAFLTLNNLLNARIQRWQHIPTMGFWLMAGVTYSF